jgi:hypothetical protein
MFAKFSALALNGMDFALHAVKAKRYELICNGFR